VDVATDSRTLIRAKRIITERPGLSHKELARDLELQNDRHFKSRIAPRLREDGFTYDRQRGWQPERLNVVAWPGPGQIMLTGEDKEAIRAIRRLARDGKLRELTDALNHELKP
jgi:hypothetical protein